MTRPIALAAAVLLLLAGAADARAMPGPPTWPTGYDISYPQCGGAFPSKAGFGIVGVNNGIVFSANPCLGGANGELAWAERHEPVAILYANTANPGAALSSHWPTGQTSPQNCDPLLPDSLACSYDYGWNAAADSYRDAVEAYISLGRLPVGATRTPQPNAWWLDVEAANSWETNTANNVAALQGAAGSLRARGVTSIGFYANAGDWRTITGATTTFSAFPSWRPGADSQRVAVSYCGTTGVTGGIVAYSQFASAGYDGDVRC